MNTPVDKEKALEILGGDEDMFYHMLGQFESMAKLEEVMAKLATCVEQEDWANMKEAAHSLKGASGYIGAMPIHQACLHI